MRLENFIFPAEPPESHQLKDMEYNLDKYFVRLRAILNNGLNFADNFSSYVTTFTTSAVVGTETAIAHGLKRIPVGFIVLEKDKAAHIYTGTTAKSVTNYYVRSDVASVTVTLVIL